MVGKGTAAKRPNGLSLSLDKHVIPSSLMIMVRNSAQSTLVLLFFDDSPAQTNSKMRVVGQMVLADRSNSLCACRIRSCIANSTGYMTPSS